MRRSWLEFVPNGTSRSGKTRLWIVQREDGAGRLGAISWYAGWRRYVFAPDPGAVFEWDCLRDIAEFCEVATLHHRLERKYARQVAADQHPT